MKTTLTLIVSVLLSVSLLQAETLRVSGKLMNAATQEPIEYATIVLQTSDSVFVNGVTSNQAGSFVIDNLSPGDFRLIITSVGFDTAQVELVGLNKSTDVGTVEMHESSTQLAEVTVEGAPVLNKADRKLYLVNETQIAGSSNGMNLITKLEIPRLMFNPLENSVTAVDNKNIEFRINDIPATKMDILALQPRDVVRVEFIDNPGLKYGPEAGYVLNYIVRKRQSGGSASADLGQAVNRHFMSDYVQAKAHSGKSEFSMSYYFKSIRLGGLMRTNKEIFRFQNGEERVREEIGTPSLMSEVQHNANLGYNYTDPDKRVLNATLRFNGYSNPNSDFVSQSYWQHNPLRKIEMKDLNFNKSNTPWVDVYYQEKLKNDQTLIFNLVYIKRLSDLRRHYSETLNGVILTDIDTKVKGDRDTYIGEALYEKTFAAGKLTTGLKHQQSYTTNTYAGDVDTKTNMVQYDSYLYAEFSGKIREKMDYVAGVGVSRVQVNQENASSLENYFFQPRVRFRYHLNDASYIGLESRIYNRTPSLSQLSAVCQPIDSLQKQCGNPMLKSWLNYNNVFTYSYSSNVFDVNAEVQYRYANKPVMSEKLIDKDGIFVHTFDNQENWQRLNFELSVGYRPFRWLSLQFSGGHTSYTSVGNRYLHRYNDFYHSESITLKHKRLSLMVANQRGARSLFGEDMDAQESIHLVDFTYSHPKFSTGITILNPFTKTYERQSENFSDIAPRQHTWYSNQVRGLAMLKFSYNLRWGEEYKSARRRMNNTDSESGILSGGK